MWYNSKFHLAVSKMFITYLQSSSHNENGCLFQSSLYILQLKIVFIKNCTVISHNLTHCKTQMILYQTSLKSKRGENSSWYASMKSLINMPQLCAVKPTEKILHFQSFSKKHVHIRFQNVDIFCYFSSSNMFSLFDLQVTWLLAITTFNFKWWLTWEIWCNSSACEDYSVLGWDAMLFGK
jgi:hypothetical protein